jgi:hypothetical protein
MNFFQNSIVLQKMMRFSFLVMGYAFTAGLTVFLVLAWVLTGPLFQIGEWIAHEENKKAKINDILKRKL